MIVDVHCHVWNFPCDFSADFIRQAGRARPGHAVDFTARQEDYLATAPQGVRTIVFGGKARMSGLWVDDALVAACAAAHPGRVTGFLALDPNTEGWLDDMRRGHEELGLRGIKLMPMYAGFSPDEERLEPMWSYAEERGLPVLLHTGTTFVSQAPLAFTLPRLIEPVAQAWQCFRGCERPALPAVAVVSQPDACPGIRSLEQSAVRHGLPLHHRQRQPGGFARLKQDGRGHLPAPAGHGANRANDPAGRAWLARVVRIVLYCLLPAEGAEESAVVGRAWDS
jgi:hypothetical protein